MEWRPGFMSLTIQPASASYGIASVANAATSAAELQAGSGSSTGGLQPDTVKISQDGIKAQLQAAVEASLQSQVSASIQALL